MLKEYHIITNNRLLIRYFKNHEEAAEWCQVHLDTSIKITVNRVDKTVATKDELYYKDWSASVAA